MSIEKGPNFLEEIVAEDVKMENMVAVYLHVSRLSRMDIYISVIQNLFVSISVWRSSLVEKRIFVSMIQIR